jgi:hypothetical protein
VATTAESVTQSPDLGSHSLVLAVVDEYRDAEKIVRRLAERDFPVEHVRIVGEDLRTVEHVTGRLTIWSAIGRSALTGAVSGLLFGWLFGLFAWMSPLVTGLLLAFYGLVAGAIIGAIWGGIFYAVEGSRRQFASFSTLAPSRYEVLVDVAWAARAQELLASSTTSDSTPSETPKES